MPRSEFVARETQLGLLDQWREEIKQAVDKVKGPEVRLDADRWFRKMWLKAWQRRTAGVRRSCQ